MKLILEKDLKKMSDIHMDQNNIYVSLYDYSKLLDQFTCFGEPSDDEIEDENIEQQEEVEIKMPKEKKCKYCGKINDIGAATCWNCVRENPTDYV